MDTINHTLISFFYAFLGGIIPSMLWLFFWTREKKDNPEPARVITIAFIGGVAGVFISLFIEKVFFEIDPAIIFQSPHILPILKWFEHISITRGIPLNRLLLVTVFAPIIEEVIKFFMAYILVLRSSDDNEAIDPMIYMITTALGFAAIENMLFLIDPISKNNLVVSILTGNMRFVGATLLHTVSSATIGIFIGFSFFEKRWEEVFWTCIGIISAIIIHGVFNFFLMNNDNYFIVLEVIWIVVIIILLAFEKVKKIKLDKITY